MITARDWKILFMRYGIPIDQAAETVSCLPKPMTLSEIGDAVFLSKERVRQILLRVEHHIRAVIREDGGMERIPCSSIVPGQSCGVPARRVLYQRIGRVAERQIPHDDPRLNVRVASLEISVRLCNTLQKNHPTYPRFEYVGQLVQAREIDLFKIPGFGRKALAETKDALGFLSLGIGMEIVGGCWSPCENTRRFPDGD